MTNDTLLNTLYCLKLYTTKLTLKTEYLYLN